MNVWVMGWQASYPHDNREKWLKKLIIETDFSKVMVNLQYEVISAVECCLLLEAVGVILTRAASNTPSVSSEHTVRYSELLFQRTECRLQVKE